MDRKAVLALAAGAGLLLWSWSRNKQAAGSAAQPGLDAPAVPVKPLDEAIVRVQQGSSGQILTPSGGVAVAAPVAQAIASGGDPVSAAEQYVGHQIVGWTPQDYQQAASAVNGMSLHQILNYGLYAGAGVPAGVVPLEITAYLEYKTQGYSANFQQLITPELIARLDPIWNAEEARGETVPWDLIYDPLPPDQRGSAQSPTQSGTPAQTGGTAAPVAADPYPYKCPIDGAMFATGEQLAAHNAQFHSQPAYSPPAPSGGTTEPAPAPEPAPNPYAGWTDEMWAAYLGGGYAGM